MCMDVLFDVLFLAVLIRAVFSRLKKNYILYMQKVGVTLTIQVKEARRVVELGWSYFDYASQGRLKSCRVVRIQFKTAFDTGGNNKVEMSSFFHTV